MPHRFICYPVCTSMTCNSYSNTFVVTTCVCFVQVWHHPSHHSIMTVFTLGTHSSHMQSTPSTRTCWINWTWDRVNCMINWRWWRPLPVLLGQWWRWCRSWSSWTLCSRTTSLRARNVRGQWLNESVRIARQLFVMNVRRRGRLGSQPQTTPTTRTRWWSRRYCESYFRGDRRFGGRVEALTKARSSYRSWHVESSR